MADPCRPAASPVWLPVIPQQDLDFPVHLIEIEFSREERNTVTFSVEAV